VPKQQGANAFSDLVEEQHESAEGVSESFDRHVSEEKLHFLANHDALTGLLNRQGLYDALSEALDEFAVWGNEPALMLLDLDGFKSFNDMHGHGFGDELLRAAGERLAEVVAVDDRLGRLGSDEFAIVMDPSDAADSAMQAAQAIIERLSEPFRIGDKQVSVTASCGVALASAASSDMDELVKAANLAIHHAKRLGAGSAVLFEPRFQQEEEDRKLLISDLRQAVENGQFVVYYQPLMDMGTRKVVSFEALLRWPHETRGNISPEIFIPLAEETGLIVELGAWVLEQACLEAATWPDPIRIAVNLSPIQFKSPVLVSALCDVLAKTGLAPGRLELEITEGVLLGEEKNNIKVLDAFRELGVRIAIDDFGTGYSSLGYLQKFKFDKIKIDKRFVQNLGTDYSSSAIIHTIINLSKQIGIKTTGEGIETEEQFHDMHELGCIEAQGYLFSRPLSAMDAREFIATNMAE
jgi:diguanylate cyclase (GGDEF)-like protein